MKLAIKPYGDYESEDFPDGFGGVAEQAVDATEIMQIGQQVRDLIAHYGFLVIKNPLRLNEVPPTIERGASFSLWHQDDLGFDYSGLSLRKQRRHPTLFVPENEAVVAVKSAHPLCLETVAKDRLRNSLFQEFLRSSPWIDDEDREIDSDLSLNHANVLLAQAQDIYRKSPSATAFDWTENPTALVVFARNRTQTPNKGVLHGCFPLEGRLENEGAFGTGGALNMYHIKVHN